MAYLNCKLHVNNYQRTEIQVTAKHFYKNYCTGSNITAEAMKRLNNSNNQESSRVIMKAESLQLFFCLFYYQSNRKFTNFQLFTVKRRVQRVEQLQKPVV